MNRVDCVIVFVGFLLIILVGFHPIECLPHSVNHSRNNSNDPLEVSASLLVRLIDEGARFHDNEKPKMAVPLSRKRREKTPDATSKAPKTRPLDHYPYPDRMGWNGGYGRR